MPEAEADNDRAVDRHDSEFRIKRTHGDIAVDFGADVGSAAAAAATLLLPGLGVGAVAVALALAVAVAAAGVAAAAAAAAAGTGAGAMAVAVAVAVAVVVVTVLLPHLLLLQLLRTAAREYCARQSRCFVRCCRSLPSRQTARHAKADIHRCPPGLRQTCR